MGPWLHTLPTTHMRLPTRSLENATVVRCTEKHSCKPGEEPESFVPFDGLWSGSVSARRQGRFLNFAHGRGDGGSRRRSDVPQQLVRVRAGRMTDHVIAEVNLSVTWDIARRVQDMESAGDG